MRENGDIKNLYYIYEKKKAIIKDFLLKTKNRNDEYVLGELFFCILAAQAKAQHARRIVNKLKEEGNLFAVNIDDLKRDLNYVRFVNKKASYVMEARNRLDELKEKLNLEPVELRNWLASKEGIKGFGLKESSHFLRNIGIGFGRITIIDVHIQQFLKDVGIFDGEIGKINKNSYLELEKKFLDLAKELKIPPEELDIAVWLYKSGEKEFYG